MTTKPHSKPRPDKYTVTVKHKYHQPPVQGFTNWCDTEHYIKCSLDAGYVVTVSKAQPTHPSNKEKQP